MTELALRYRFTGQIAPAVRAVLDPNKLIWVQESTVDHHTHRTTFTMKPEHYGSRLDCAGSYVFEPGPDGSTLQRVTGRVKVHFPLVGGTVEKAIVNGLREHIQSEAAIVERWSGVPVNVIAEGASAAYLYRTNQVKDLDYILTHIDDLNEVYRFEREQVVKLSAELLPQ